jgi:hypothetical protein
LEGVIGSFNTRSFNGKIRTILLYFNRNVIDILRPFVRKTRRLLLFELLELPSSHNCGIVHLQRQDADAVLFWSKRCEEARVVRRNSHAEPVFVGMVLCISTISVHGRLRESIKRFSYSPNRGMRKIHFGGDSMYAFREINVSDCRNAIVMSRNLTSKSRLHAATANET